MKKAVIALLVVLFTGNVFASGTSCGNKSGAGLFSSTKSVSSSTSSDGSEGSK